LDDFPNFSVQQGMTSYQRPHNDFLWVFSEVGIVGGIFYILIFLSLFLMLIKLVRKKNQDQTEIQIWIAFLVAYCIVAFFDFPLERIEHQVVLWIAVARILHLYYMNFTLERRQTVLGNFILISSLLVGLFWSVGITKRYFEKEMVCHSVVLAHANSNWKEIVEWTADLDIQKQVDPFSTPLAWYRGVALVALKQNELAKDAFEIALTVAPNHIHVLNNLASCYEKLGKHELAITFYEKALRISNKFDESILNLAAVYYNMGNYEQAFEVMKRCRDYVQDAKYQRFLPAIVRTKIDLILSDCKDEKHTERLNKIKENDQILIDYFVEHKKFNCTFNDYLLIHRKK
jgi:tetratricopeptide (TPR) repeat protein